MGTSLLFKHEQRKQVLERRATRIRVLLKLPLMSKQMTRVGEWIMVRVIRGGNKIVMAPLRDRTPRSCGHVIT